PPVDTTRWTPVSTGICTTDRSAGAVSDDTSFGWSAVGVSLTLIVPSGPVFSVTLFVALCGLALPAVAALPSSMVASVAVSFTEMSGRPLPLAFLTVTVQSAGTPMCWSVFGTVTAAVHGPRFA